ncbi:glycoside hydrolase domain-containing protein [Telluria beijingensis]|uniref:glycoside hydrolase domain-containing protein n=1 Tax=Telluria beijingensis TaxID=3068633 RepID=UPI002795DD6F|nr:glycoside hydrolase domain-containing protein [Massilia sp. REN29]
MAALRGCDSPFAIADHAASLRQRGIDFVMRRYSRDPASNLDASETRRLSDAGFRIGALWESDAVPDGWSRRRGLLDGAEALRLARAAGQPPGSAIYFALGETASAADLDDKLTQYLAGLRAALGGGAGYRVGVRGSHAACAGLVDRGLAALSWLAPTPSGAAARHALLQWPAARLVLDGVELRLAPVLGQAGRDPGLFSVASGAHGDARRARFHAADHGRT